MATEIVTFGTKYRSTGSLGTGDRLVLRVQALGFLRNPHNRPALRSLDGRDPRVGQYMEKDPGFGRNYAALKLAVSSWSGTVYLCCIGGRHRSVYLAEKLGKELNIPVKHLDLDRR